MCGKNTRVRKAELHDTGPLSVVGVAAWRRGVGPHVGPDAHVAVTEAVFIDFIERHLAQILVAEIGGVPVGFVATEGGKDYLSDLWVSPDHEGLGVGSALLDAAEQVVRERGYQAIALAVMTRNERAFRLYQRRGYVVSWQGNSYDSVLGMDLHKTEMRKPL